MWNISFFIQLLSANLHEFFVEKELIAFSQIWNKFIGSDKNELVNTVSIDVHIYRMKGV